MKRYTQRIKQYSVNKLFNQDQKRKYQELNEKKNNDNSVLDANERLMRAKNSGQTYGLLKKVMTLRQRGFSYSRKKNDIITQTT